MDSLSKISLMFFFLAYSWISFDVSTGYRSARIIFIESVSLVESINFVVSSERCVFCRGLSGQG